MDVPETLNIGSGKDFREECINLDQHKMWGPDIIYDLNQPLYKDKPNIFWTTRFGNVELKKEMFKRILALDVLEHITKLTVCMQSCLDLLEFGGIMEIVVPYDLSLGAWQDPTHVRAFNQNSWLYFTKWSWYLGWQTETFLVNKMEFSLSLEGKRLMDSKSDIEKVINIPRAVNGMRVELKKCSSSLFEGGN